MKGIFLDENGNYEFTRQVPSSFPFYRVIEGKHRPNFFGEKDASISTLEMTDCIERVYKKEYIIRDRNWHGEQTYIFVKEPLC